MKILVTLIAVIALAAPVFAQVDVNITDNGGGSFTISYANATEDIAGVSMIVTLSGGDGVLAGCGDATAAAPFNANIDYFNANLPAAIVLGTGCPIGAVGAAGLPAANATSFAISTGVLLDPPAGAPMAGGDIATIQLTCTSDTTVTLSEDLDRGGIVGVSTNALTASFPAATVVACAVGGCATCFGDLNGDSLITGADIQLLVPAFGSGLGDGNYEACADGNGDNLITGADIQLLVPIFGDACN
jgi:hypothetical protein